MISAAAQAGQLRDGRELERARSAARASRRSRARTSSYDPATGRFLGEYKNGAFASVGALRRPGRDRQPGALRLADGSEQLLALSGPATAKPGETVTVKVTDAGSGAPVAGASVGGAHERGRTGRSPPARGATRGDHDLKATKDGAIRSNRVRVLRRPTAPTARAGRVPRPAERPPIQPPVVAAPDTTAPTAKLAGFKDHQVFTSGPRDLRGSFSDASGVKVVKLRLTKRVGKRCWYFSGKQERFRGTRCGTGPYFAIGDKADWSYLLPAQLGPGRYVLDAVAIDAAGNRTPLQRGTHAGGVHRPMKRLAVLLLAALRPRRLRLRRRQEDRRVGQRDRLAGLRRASSWRPRAATRPARGRR